MNSYRELLEQITTDVSGLTTTADIAYLPSGFRKTLAPMIKKLMKKKKKDKLDVQILDRVVSPNIDVLVDGELKIAVPRMYWKDFRRRFKWMFEEGHKIALKESLEEELEIDMMALRKELDDMWDREPLKGFDDEIQTVRRTFKLSYIPANEKAVFDYRIYDMQVEKFLNKVKQTYKDDRGYIEMLISAIHNRRPVGKFIEDIYGGGVGNWMAVSLKGEYSSVPMVFDGIIDSSWVEVSKFKIFDDDVVAEIAGYKSFKVVGWVVYPKAKRFTPSMIKQLKEIIDDTV